jgi:hypothetical protein
VYQLFALAASKTGYSCQPPQAWTTKTTHAVRPFQKPRSRSFHHIVSSLLWLRDDHALPLQQIRRAWAGQVSRAHLSGHFHKRL